MLRSWMRVVLAATFVVALIVLALPASASSRATATSSSLIAFDTRYSADVSQIYTIRPDGSDRHRLTNSSRRAAWDPAFSPDGSHIAFARDGRLGSVIAVMETDGTGQYRLRADAGYDDYAPAWTSDGLGIVFVRCHQAPGYPCRIARMDLAGTNLVELTGGSWHDGTGSLRLLRRRARPGRLADGWEHRVLERPRRVRHTSLRDGGGRGRPPCDLQARDRGRGSVVVTGRRLDLRDRRSPGLEPRSFCIPMAAACTRSSPGRSSRRSPLRASASWRCKSPAASSRPSPSAAVR